MTEEGVGEQLGRARPPLCIHLEAAIEEVSELRGELAGVLDLQGIRAVKLSGSLTYRASGHRNCQVPSLIGTLKFQPETLKCPIRAVTLLGCLTFRATGHSNCQSP